MDNNYLKTRDILKGTLYQIKGLIEKSPTDKFEDLKAYTVIENLIDEIERATAKINYFSLPAEEGYLKENSNERFNLNDNELTCGHPLEVNLDNEWYDGRVEHNGKYYLYNSYKGNPLLHDGMKARIRIK